MFVLETTGVLVVASWPAQDLGGKCARCKLPLIPWDKGHGYVVLTAERSHSPAGWGA